MIDFFECNDVYLIWYKFENSAKSMTDYENCHIQR